MKRRIYVFRRFIILTLLNFIYKFSKNQYKHKLQPLPEHPKLLFVINGLLGDTTMSSSAIFAARNLWPTSFICVLGKKSNIALLRGIPAINEYIESEFVPFSTKNKFSRRLLIDRIKSYKFDASLILLGNDFAKLMADAGIPVRVGVKGAPLSNCHNYLYDILSPREWGPNQKINSLRCMGYQAEYLKPVLYSDKLGESLWKELKISYGISDNYVVLHPFGSTQRQWWKLSALAELADTIKEKFGIVTVVIGGKETADAVIHGQNIIDVRGKLDISMMKLIIARSEFVISTDSGPYHIAGALGKPVVGLFRQIRPELSGIYPTVFPLFGEHHDCKQQCRWDECNFAPCKQMENISVSNIIGSLNLLDRNEN